MKKVIFWDFDGTLAYSELLWSGSVNKALALYYKDSTITIEQLRPHMRNIYTWDTPEKDYTGMTNAAWWDFMFSQFSRAYQNLGIEKSTADYISSKTRQIILDVNNYHLYEDTVTTLNRCKLSGFKNYILSNNYPELGDIIEKLNISQYFEDYIISAKIGYDKPRKEIFKYALDLAGRPELCYMVGDNPIADISGANRMGIKSVLVHKNKACGADFICESLEDVADLLIKNQ